MESQMAASKRMPHEFRQWHERQRTGRLDPIYIETDYKIGYTVVSLIFVANAIGFIAVALLNTLS